MSNLCIKSLYQVFVSSLNDWLNKHRKTAHTDITCDFCGIMFEHLGLLIKHNRSKHPEKKKCEICGELITKVSVIIVVEFHSVH